MPTSAADAAAQSELPGRERQRLLDVAREALDHGVRNGTALRVELDDQPPILREPRGCFVTLQKAGQLRGCLGSLEARGPLVQEVARLAYAAAKRDPRFSPVTADELPDIGIKLSVLSVPTPLHVTDEAHLVEVLRPGVDGVIFADGDRLATFLPDVWDSFPTPIAFLNQLRTKAGLPADHWSDTVRLQRYTTESF